MEKTMARAIYKRMEIGKPYTTYSLFQLIGETAYYSFIPTEMHGKSVNKIVANEMWKVVNTGYARTYIKKEMLPNVRGLRYGSTPTSFTEYHIRYWVRTK
jgi:hypothetical protein